MALPAKVQPVSQIKKAGPTGSIGKAPVGGKAAPPSDINAYLTNDPTYQNQMSAILRAIGDYRAQELNAETNYNTNYASQRADLQDQQRIATTNQNEDYGSRGMLRSGLFGVAAGQLGDQYARRFSDLDMSKNQYLTGLQQDMYNYQQQQLLAQQQARQDAINRRAIALSGSSSPTAVR